MRYQAAPLPEPQKPLGFAGERGKAQVPFAAASGGTWQERARGVPDYPRTVFFPRSPEPSNDRTYLQKRGGVMEMGADLFGEPVLRRSAFFPRTGIRRKLSRRWGPGPIACVIGCNPSDAGEDREDNTSLWWNRWFQHYGYGGYDGVNFYSFVASDPRLCRERVRNAFAGEWYDRDELFENRDYVARVAKNADQVFVCFGNIANEIDFDWNESVLEEIQTGVEPYPDLWCWGKTKHGAPTHPMARGKHRIDPLVPAILWRAA